MVDTYKDKMILLEYYHDYHMQTGWNHSHSWDLKIITIFINIQYRGKRGHIAQGTNFATYANVLNNCNKS